ncbi:MAG: Vi polysaccharide biosynthesis protein VipB/TviC [Elusimicrobia bacterium RIFOXYB2_FULL_49_7]|nr:MAG: Vi polysaccharide biosynthesis protein VipB/TviC [Elusimicrobia bacterium RIFOXYB2_FULL_49_7]
MRYLVTGGCGFIGSHICEELVNEGHEVTIFDNLSSGYEHNIAAFKDKVRFIQADVRDKDALTQATRGVDYLFHEAALVSVFDSVERPGDNNDINITGTLNVLLAARENKVKRVVVASSAAIYGNDPTLPKREEMKPQPESPYALAKILKEYYFSVFHKLYGLETVCLRYFNVFGPRQDPSSMYSGVISKFTDNILNNKQTYIFGDGGQTRDFVFVKDVVQANLLAMRSPKAGKGDVFNVATGRTVSLLDLLNTLSKIEGRNIKPEFKPERSGDIRRSAASIDKATAVLGYAPKFTLFDGLKALLDYLKGHKR